MLVDENRVLDAFQTARIGLSWFQAQTFHDECVE